MLKERHKPKLKCVQLGGQDLVSVKPILAHSDSLICTSGPSIIVYSAKSGLTLQQLEGHKSDVSAIAIHPANQFQLLSCDQLGHVIRWEFMDGVMLKEYDIGPQYHKFYFCGVANPEIFVQLKGADSSGKAWVHMRFLPSEFETLDEVTGLQSRHSQLAFAATYTAGISPKELVVVHKKKSFVYSSPKKEKFTCIACHPENKVIATGLTNGAIFLWWNFLKGGIPTTSKLHWHCVSVICLAFSPAGSFLLSGGHECTLVKWDIGTRKIETLPRLGFPLQHITTSKDSATFALCHASNTIQLVSSTFHVLCIIEGFTRAYEHLRRSVGLLHDPITGALVTNGRPGHLQFYQISSDTQLFNLDVVNQNYVSSRFRDKPLHLTDVEQAAFSSCGDWLVTFEHRDDGVTIPVAMLKFWRYATNSQRYALDTCVEFLPSEMVTAMMFSPKELILVTSLTNHQFKLWLQIQDYDIQCKSSNSLWTCRHIGFFRELPTGPVDFSFDGSLLAVAFCNIVTLWNPVDNVLRHELVSSSEEKILSLKYGGKVNQTMLFSAHKDKLVAWELLSCDAKWVKKMKISVIVVDPVSSCLGVFVDQELLFLNSMTAKTLAMASLPDEVESAVFLPKQSSDNFEFSPLYFSTANQKLFSIRDTSRQKVSQKHKFRNEEATTPFASFLASQRRRQEGHDRTVDNLRPSEDHVKIVTELTNTPSHVMPSVRMLSQAFLTSMMKQLPVKDEEDRMEETIDDEQKTKEEKCPAVIKDYSLKANDSFSWISL